MNNQQITIARDERGLDIKIDFEVSKHLIIAGRPDSGKTTLLNNIIYQFLTGYSPEDFKLILIDTRQVKLTHFNNLPHLLTPIITDKKQAILAMKWVGREICRRYDILKNNSARNIGEYHKTRFIIFKKNETKTKFVELDFNEQELMPRIIITLGELSDLMQIYPRETESALLNIIKTGHTVGVHIIITTSILSKMVLTDSIRSLINPRITFKTSSPQDSKTMIGNEEAYNIKDAGVMFYQSGNFKYPVYGKVEPISTSEIEKEVKQVLLKNNNEIMTEINLEVETKDDYHDELYEQAREIAIANGKVSTSYLQRKLGIGYCRSALLIDRMEAKGVIGPANGSRRRKVYGKKKIK